MCYDTAFSNILLIKKCICPVHKMHWGNVSADPVGVANKLLVQLKVHTTRGSLRVISPECSGARGKIAQTPLIETNTTSKTLVNEMIPNNILLCS